MKKIGFIGCGNMGKAIVLGLLNSTAVEIQNLSIAEKNEHAIKAIKNEIGIDCISNIELAKECDIIFLAIKPNVYKDVITEIKDYVKPDTIIVSIAAGITISDIEEWFDKEIKIVRTMPNTPALVAEGMSAICPNKNVTEEELKYVCNLYNSFGKYEIIAEKDFNAFIALCGSSPAYVFVFIEAMADAACKLGLPRAQAYKMAEQSILGSAKLALETGKHPAELKDMVCSPGGTTIEAVAELEKNGFRNSVIQCMLACAEKGNNLK